MVLSSTSPAVDVQKYLWNECMLNYSQRLICQGGRRRIEMLSQKAGKEFAGVSGQGRRGELYLAIS